MKDSKDVLGSVLKTAQMGQVGLRCVLEAPIDPALERSLRSQLGVYDRIEEEALGLADCRKWRVQQLNPAVRAWAKTMTQMKLSGGDVDSRAAAMVIRGNTRGLIKGTRNLHSLSQEDAAVTGMARRLLNAEEESTRQLQRFL